MVAETVVPLMLTVTTTLLTRRLPVESLVMPMAWRFAVLVMNRLCAMKLFDEPSLGLSVSCQKLVP